MTPLQLELTRLIGSKELTFGCRIFGDRVQGPLKIISHTRNDEFLLSDLRKYDLFDGEKCIIGHPATLSDFHRWILSNGFFFKQEDNLIIVMTVRFWGSGGFNEFLENPSSFWGDIPYDPSRDLLDQDEETLKQIIELIRNNK